MKIENSHVNMASSHNSYSYSHVEVATIDQRVDEKTLGAIMKISEEGEKSYKEAIEQYQKENQQRQKEVNQQNLQNMFNNMAEQEKRIREANGGRSQWDFEDLEVSIVKKILDLLNGKPGAKSELDKKMSEQQNAFKEWQRRIMGAAADGCDDVHFSVNGVSAKTLNLSSLEAASRVQVWQRVTAVEGEHLEYENTTFASQGTVQTADGRSLNFNVEVSLGRSLSQKINSLTSETYTRILTDPLVINMDSNITSVSDKKFKFDLDSDGKEDEISFAGAGSGFLALDKNNDGKINDGSELFGTKSGDGFKDLAAYDEDRNGWIDENDAIFSKLKVWTKDENGNDKLLDLKKADVGAIYLHNADTEFSFKNADGVTDGVLRKTGIYLKESTGQAGTVAHVDFSL